MSNRTILLLASLVPILGVTAASPPSQRGQDPFVRFDLPGGVKLAVLHLEDAPKQSTFTFLPQGLVSDGPGAAQFSHLIEHMLIRSTDPLSLAPEGMQINGETTSASLRLDTYAETDHWRESVERHVAWLTADEFSAEVLEREKGRIAGEEQNTVAGGYTHKWAEAAWNQVVVHGRGHAAVHGDVAGASVDDVRTHVERRVRLGSEVTIASVGPIDPEEIRDALAKALDEARGEGAEEPVFSTPVEPEELRTGSIGATWDLAAHHYLEWIPLPDESAVDRVAAHAAANLLLIGLGRDANFGNGRALASVVTVRGERFLVLSASVSGPDAAEEAQRAFERGMEIARKGGGMSLSIALVQLRAQALNVPDPAPIRKRLEQMGRDASLVDAQLALNLVNLEWSLGLGRAEIGEAWDALDTEGMESFLDGLPSERSSLLLSPKPK